MSESLNTEDAKRLSMKLLLISGVAAIFVLAYILSRISPEARGIRVLASRPTASKNQSHRKPDTPGLGAVQKDSAAAADEHFLESMQCTDPDVLVKMGRR